MAINYTAKQGDCIFSIAFENGFFADTIWNHPNNAELKKQREDPNVLMPGDIVFVPDKRLKEVSEPTNQVHKFRCKNTPKTLRIQIVRLGIPVKDMEYKVDIDGTEKEGKTDGEGWLNQAVAPNAQRAKLVLADGSEYELKLGHLDPIDETTGIQGRLRSLGYYEGSLNGQLDDETKEALKVFQRSNDLEATGEADGQTKALLIKMTGE
jgi:hypothetical protein